MRSNRSRRVIVWRRRKLGKCCSGGWSCSVVRVVGCACDTPRTSGDFSELVVYPCFWIGGHRVSSIRLRRVGLSLSDENRAAAVERVRPIVLLAVQSFHRKEHVKQL